MVKSLFANYRQAFTVGTHRMPFASSLAVAAGLQLSAVVGDVLDKTFDEFFDGPVKRTLEDTFRRVRATAGHIPPNHDLEHAIRTSELASSLALLSVYASRKKYQQVAKGGVWDDPFISSARGFLLEELGGYLGQGRNNAELSAEIDRHLDLLLSESVREIMTFVRCVEREA